MYSPDRQPAQVWSFQTQPETSDLPIAFTPGTSSAPSSARMVRRHRPWSTRYRRGLLITDHVVILSAVLIAYFTRWAWELDDLGAVTAHGYGILPAIFIATWSVMLALHKTRDPHVIGYGTTEYARVAGASILAFGILAIVAFIMEFPVVRGLFLIALPLGLVGLVGSRWMWRRWLTVQRAKGRLSSRALVVGQAADVQDLLDAIGRSRRQLFDVIGVATDDQLVDPLSVRGRRVPVLSDLSQVPDRAAAHHVDAVIVAGSPGSSRHFLRDLGWDLEGTGAELVVASRMMNVAGPRVHLRPVDGLPLMHVEIPQFSGGKHLIKRTLDVCVSGIAILLLLPLLVAIGFLVHRDSPGPVLFRQERVGRDGVRFRMLKFRSMVESAEDDLHGLLDANEGSGVLFKMRNDPRVTRIGRVLRKYSLDELPQLWNVFIGEMSLVGPRPPLEREVAEYDHRVHRRLLIKPGITGMWQISGRSDLSWEESVRLDLYYVENWSVTDDLVIMWRTVRVILNPTGAY